MATTATFTGTKFTFAPDHPLAVEHVAVAEGRGSSIINGPAKDPAVARRYVAAAAEQVAHWDEQVERIRAAAPDAAIARQQPDSLPGMKYAWTKRRAAAELIINLMKRALPLTREDLLALSRWVTAAEYLSPILYPLVPLTRAIERFARDNDLDVGLRAAVEALGAKFTASTEKDIKALGTRLHHLVRRDQPLDAVPATAAIAAEDVPAARPVVPAPAGDPRVLVQLKQTVGVAAPDAPLTPPPAPTPEDFAPNPDSPLAEEHRLLGELLEEVVMTGAHHEPSLEQLRAGAPIIAADDGGRGRLLLAAAERIVAWDAYHAYSPTARVIETLPNRICRLGFDLDRNGIFDYLLFVTAGLHHSGYFLHEEPLQRFIGRVGAFASEAPLTDGERYVLHVYRASLIMVPPLGKSGEEVARLTQIIGDGARFFLVPGEAWSDAVNADHSALPADVQRKWVDLLAHLLTATGSRPTARWLKAAKDLVTHIGAGDVAAALERWFPFVSKGRTVYKPGRYDGDTRSTGDVMHEQNATVLRGMLWLVPSLKGHDLSRLVTAVALSAYKKIPGVGPRAVKVGNACIYALSELASPETVGQLAMLKVRVKFGTAQKEIEKAFNAAAAALGLPRDQVEEMGVPSYGLEDVGHRHETFAGGEFAADVRVDGRDVELTWSRVSDGKPLKSVPAKVKSAHKDELKELQQSVKDVAGMLPAQAERIDGLFLAQKTWPAAQWRERYLDHPLVGTIARRLIWIVDGRPVTWLRDGLVDIDGKPVPLTNDATVTLWHPIDGPVEEVVAWRAFLQRHEIRQPFKQAHRELYVLTDAERRTQSYSNRFAAHILRQHQFNALCAARGWRNRLRLMVDDEFPPATRELPHWGLRAEFWIEGVGDDHATDANDSGAFLRIATDQVRFYRAAAATSTAHAYGGAYTARAAGPGVGDVNEPLPLEQIPPLVFSEVMRDVDLFVGVASVGNDPTWVDGGPGGRYRDYWQTYSFGELSETAKTRRAVLETLLPRMTKLRDRWTLEDRFLVIRGDVRSYKIHLGSGNILMLPNDQYLCIVPGRSGSGAAASDVLLPFEGDQTLSIILSKALLLAADTKITDSSITRQIGGPS